MTLERICFNGEAYYADLSAHGVKKFIQTNPTQLQMSNGTVWEKCPKTKNYFLINRPNQLGVQN